MTREQEFIPWAKPDFWGQEQEYLVEALQSTWISGGAFVDRFEQAFSDYCGSRYALTASNGTTAIHMVYLALGLEAGDEIIVPGFCFLAVANLALHMGIKPVFAEIDPQTWCIDAAGIEPLITQRTRAIVPVHTYGNVCDMDEIMAVAGRHRIPVIEDTAEAFASLYKGRQAGTMGDVGTYSFQATKTITCGEGGMVVTEDEELFEKMALYRSHGMLRKTHYWHELPGHNFRLTNLQAAIGLAQLEKIDLIIEQRKYVYEKYTRSLQDIPGVHMQVFLPDIDVVLWTSAIRLDEDAFPQGRDAVIQQMKEAMIETRPGFYTPNRLDHIYRCERLPVCDRVSRQVVCLPTYPSLQDWQIDRITSTLKSLRR